MRHQVFRRGKLSNNIILDAENKDIIKKERINLQNILEETHSDAVQGCLNTILNRTSS